MSTARSVHYFDINNGTAVVLSTGDAVPILCGTADGDDIVTHHWDMVTCRRCVARRRPFDPLRVWG